MKFTSAVFAGLAAIASAQQTGNDGSDNDNTSNIVATVVATAVATNTNTIVNTNVVSSVNTVPVLVVSRYVLALMNDLINNSY